MSKYLMKYKNIYRLKCPYDLQTKDFPRMPDGKIDSSYDDIYIHCALGTQIYHYGHGILCALVITNQRSRRFVREINAIDESIILDYLETDLECLIRFKDKNLKRIIHIFQPRTSGATISPFSCRNLPSNKHVYEEYEIKSQKLLEVKEMLSEIYETDKSIHLKLYKYLKSLDKKKNYVKQKYSPFNMIEVNGHVDQAFEFLI